ncbi:hypothetical protein [Streptomyces sp. UG1]|uniref:hypothetical protein n=1 Tax=Streptomyces sp. UG1 TaxID=3417652 RepID=UPI003CEB9DE0
MIIGTRRTTAHQLSRTDARRIAVRAQLLDGARRPGGLLDVVRRLTLLQVDPTVAVAPSADLVAWSRLGSSGYAPADLTAAPADRTLPELRAMIRPGEDLALYRAEMAQWPQRGTPSSWREYHGMWVAANDACRRDILGRLAAAGPLPSRELPDTCELPWRSSGWSDNRDVTKLLELMVQRGEVAVAGRSGGRVYPDTPAVPVRRRCVSGTSGGCAPWASRAPGARSARSSRRSSRACGASGGSIRPSWGSRSPDGPPCCRRSTG